MSDSCITKQAIAYGLKTAMKKKPFQKITISDITKACGLNRQSFYYHFHDKYDLLNWIFCNEVFVVLTTQLSIQTWPQNLYQMLCVLNEQKVFYKNALKNSYENEFHDYLYHISYTLITSVIEHIDEKNDIKETDKQFLAKFFSFGVVDSIILWVTEDMTTTPRELIQSIVSLVNACKVYAVKQSCNEL